MVGVVVGLPLVVESAESFVESVESGERVSCFFSGLRTACCDGQQQ